MNILPSRSDRVLLAVLLHLLTPLRSALVDSAPPQCSSDHCAAGDDIDRDTVYGTEFLYDGHTVILAEGTKAEMEEPGWSSSFGMHYAAEDDTCAAMGWRQRAEPRRVWDAFTFFNELDVLR